MADVVKMKTLQLMILEGKTDPLIAGGRFDMDFAFLDEGFEFRVRDAQVRDFIWRGFDVQGCF